MYKSGGSSAETKPPEERLPAAEERLPAATVRQLVAGVEELETDLRRLRVRVSAPDRCEVLLEELVRLQHGVERLALAVVDAHLEARLLISDDIRRDVLALKPLLDRIADAVWRAES